MNGDDNHPATCDCRGCVWARRDHDFSKAARAYCAAWTRDNRNNFTDGPGREMARTRSDLFNAYKKLAEVETRGGGS